MDQIPMETIANLAFTTVALFLASWVILFLLMFLISPFFTRYGDKRSRFIYSAVYSLAFALIVGLGYGVMPVISAQYGFWIALAGAFVIVLILTMLQNYVLMNLIRRGLLKMEKK
jgi:hypothetical protein